MNLIEADLAPERELNEILWKSVRGADSVMPAPVRAAFVRPISDGDEEDRGGRGRRRKRRPRTRAALTARKGQAGKRANGSV